MGESERNNSRFAYLKPHIEVNAFHLRDTSTNNVRGVPALIISLSNAVNMIAGVKDHCRGANSFV